MSVSIARGFGELLLYVSPKVPQNELEGFLATIRTQPAISRTDSSGDTVGECFKMIDSTLHS